MKRLILLILALFVFRTVPSYAQNWSGILTTDRAMDWSHNGATIVNRSTQCGATIAAYTGTAATISNALNACPAGQFVNLGAGTFTLSTTLKMTNSNATLRGQGPNSTFLVWTAEDSNCNGVGRTAVCIINGDSSSFQFSGAHNATVTGTFTQGQTSLTFANVTGLAIGSNVIFTQNDDASDPGNIWISQTNGFDGAASQQGGSGVAKAGQSQTQNVTVTNIFGNIVTFTPGLAAPNWTITKVPNAWWSNNPTATGVGVENLTLDYSGLGSAENGIEFHNENQGWVKNIRSINSVSSGGATHKHVNIYASNHITVRDSYFYGASPTSEGYGVDFGPGSANNLAENNVFQHLPTGMITETSCCNVFGYNFAIDNYYNNGAPNWQQQDSFHHGAGDYYNLWEGNEGIGFDADDIHGTGFFLTDFRDYRNGHDPATEVAAKNQATFAYFPFSNARGNNAVAGVYGTSTYHTHYQNTPTTANPPDCTGANGDSAHSVWVFGFGDQAGSGYSPACLGSAFIIYNDPLVASSQMRWGNYTACTGDAACGSVRYQSSETGSTFSTYPGLASPSSTFPASFYLSAQPGFWGSMPWPAIGPDVTGGNVANVGGHVYLTPAANCGLNVMGINTNGSSGALSFDASTCYSSTPTVIAPSITPSSGAYTSPQTITITDATSGATVCYTVDGSTPTANGAGTCTHGTTYSTGFSQSIPVTVKAIGSKSGMADSSVSTNTYTLSAGAATINWTNVHQVIDGFGAAEPFYPNANLTTGQRNLFFGTGAGQLGLSILRVAAPSNGDYGQGDCSTVSSSCAGTYVPDMQAIISHGGRVVATPWSPPAAYKTNGSLVCTAGAGNGALASASYANYATWLTNFVKSLQSVDSVNLYALSMQNEPNLCPAYDGALWTAANFDTFVKTNLGPTFASNSISTLVFLPETENYSGLSGSGGTCFTDASCYNYVAGTNWHDYDATANSSGSTNATPNPWASLNKKYWETEASCGLGYGPSGCEGGSFVTDMTSDGLMWAGLIDNRISVQNANAYLYWALIGPTTDNEGLTTTTGTVAKRAYVFGQYSAFVRPGYYRIDATHQPQSGIAVSAYQNTSSGNLVIVATNYNSSAISQSFSITNGPGFGSVTPYITSTSLSLAAQSAVGVSSNSFTYLLPAQSVTTFVGSSSTPTITSALTANCLPTIPGCTYQITATNSPTSFSASGLPTGLSINTSTGSITGTPTTAGTYSVSLGASNGAGTGTATLAFTIGYFVQATGALGGSATLNVTSGHTLYGFAFCGTNPCTFSFTSTNEAGSWSTPIKGTLATDGDQIAISCVQVVSTGADTVTATGTGAGVVLLQLYETAGTTCTLDTTTSPSGGYSTSNSTQTSPISSASITTTTANDLMFFYAGDSTQVGASDHLTPGGTMTNLTCMDTSGYNPTCTATGHGFEEAVGLVIQTTPGATTATINSSAATSKEYGTIYAAFKPFVTATSGVTIGLGIFPFGP